MVGGSLGIIRSRATSSSSLISEVISLKKFHVHRANKHCRLAEEEEEDIDAEEFKKIERDATSLTTLRSVIFNTKFRKLKSNLHYKLYIIFKKKLYNGIFFIKRTKFTLNLNNIVNLKRLIMELNFVVIVRIVEI